MLTSKALGRGSVALLLFAAAVACPACARTERPLYPVHGAVFFEGKPLAKALVVLYPVGGATPRAARPRAVVEGDGSFKIFTTVAGDGAPEGDYNVAVITKRPKATAPKPEKSTAVRAVADGGTKKAEHRKRKDMVKKAQTGGPAVAGLPERYQHPDASGLRIHVSPGMNELPRFDLKK